MKINSQLTQLFFFLFSALVLICCQSESEKKKNDLILDSVNTKKPEWETTIITDTAQINWTCHDMVHFWIPDSNHILEAEIILRNAIESQKSDSSIQLDTSKLQNYYRQYIFYVDTAGDSMIFINALCDIPGKIIDSSGISVFKPNEWKNKLTFYIGGDDCDWHICINLSKKKWSRFKVNSFD